MDIPSGWLSKNPRCGRSTLILAQVKTGEIMLFPALCHTWRCEYCAHARARLYTKAIYEAKPQFAWEFTTRQAANRNSLADCEKYLSALPKIFRAIRRDHGPMEYFWTYELFKRGGAHVHGLSRGAHPSRDYFSEQAELAGIGYVSDFRPIRSTSADICHAVKYLFKAHSKAYLEGIPSRRIHLSRHFLTCPIRDFGKSPDPDYAIVDIRFQEPPHVFAAMQGNEQFARAFLCDQTPEGHTLREFRRSGSTWSEVSALSTIGETHDDEPTIPPTHEESIDAPQRKTEPATLEARHDQDRQPPGPAEPVYTTLPLF